MHDTGKTIVSILLLGMAVVAFAADGQVPRGFTLVRPVASRATAAPAQLQIGQTPYFSYALPPGWRIGESGQFALTLVAPDSKALTVMVGNAGMPPNASPGQYAYQNLAAMRVDNLQLGQPRQVQPIAGFQYAYAFEVRYSVNGVPCQGIAIVHVAPSYGASVMAMTAALSQSSLWSGYSTWLPLVAQQVAATNGAAFGARGIMQQNLQNSTAYAQAAKEYRDYSQRLQRETSDARGESIDRNNRQFRENVIGGVQSYANPYDAGRAVELPGTYKYYWVNPQGTYVGTNDPGVNPNNGSTQEWRKMPAQ